MNDLSMIGEPRLKRVQHKAVQVRCTALRCTEPPLGEIGPLRERIEQSGPHGNKVQEINGYGLLLSKKLDNWRNPDTWEFSPRPNWKRAAIKRINADATPQCFSPPMEFKELLRTPKDWNAIRDAHSALILGLDDQTGWSRAPDGVLPINIKCPRCKRLTRLTRENLSVAIELCNAVK
jgi:hypothetical protein